MNHEGTESRSFFLGVSVTQWFALEFIFISVVHGGVACATTDEKGIFQDRTQRRTKEIQRRFENVECSQRFAQKAFAIFNFLRGLRLFAVRQTLFAVDSIILSENSRSRVHFDYNRFRRLTMFQPYIRRRIRLQQVMTGATGLVWGILISILANILSEDWLRLVPWLVAIVIGMSIYTIVLSARNPPGIEVAIRAPIVVRTPQEAQQYARRGFVGFVPLYTPKRGSSADTLSIPERKQAVENLDFDRLQLEDSNFQPTITAIGSHTSRLEHCWLLATRGSNSPGSLPYARLLAEYLRQRKGLNCTFHFGEEFSITLDDDAIVLSKTYDQVRRVFTEAVRVGIKPNEMVADIVTGFRSMTLGMILSCLDKDQDIEFVGTHYNEFGNPGGDLFPIVFSFEPLLKQE